MIFNEFGDLIFDFGIMGQFESFEDYSATLSLENSEIISETDGEKNG